MENQHQFACYLMQGVKHHILQRLDMKPVKKEVLHLNTFGDNRFERQNCGVYKLYNLSNILDYSRTLTFTKRSVL